MLEVVSDDQEISWVVPGQLKEAAEAEQQVLKAVSGVLLQQLAPFCNMFTEYLQQRKSHTTQARDAYKSM